MNEVNAVYIHIPFCRNICSYCDFSKVFYNEKIVDKYLISLGKEIEERYKQEEIRTVYIGGGTPSSLSLEQLQKLFSIIKRLNLVGLEEFTFECNLEDISEDKMIFLKENGVNRLSIGVESFQDEILRFLERSYTSEEILGRIKLAKKYFENINIDLIYAVPNQSLDLLKKDIKSVLSLGVKHISTYSLMIEENTKLSVCSVDTISSDLDSDMYFLIHDELIKNGYEHYEISNYSVEGYQSKHNNVYWQNDRYYGFGLGASGYISNTRYTNTRSIHKYLDGDFESDIELIDITANISNEMILGLRTSCGVSKKKFRDRFGADVKDFYDLNQLIDMGQLIETDDRYYIPIDKWYLLNEILVNFV